MSGFLGGRGRVVVGLVVVVSVWVLAVGGGCAWAATGHGFAGQFGGLGDGDGQFGELDGQGPGGVGVRASTGEVFTADAAQGSVGIAPRVQRFSADGVFVSGFALAPLDGGGANDGGVSGLAVDPRGSGAVYVATGINGPITVVKYSMAGVKELVLNGGPGTSINADPRVAVDPVDGSVYVTATDVTQGLVIAKFDAVTGLLSSSFSGSDTSEAGFLCSASGLAVDGSQQVYVLDPCKNRVDRFSATGVFEISLDPQAAPQADGNSATLAAVAADPVSSEMYVAHSGPVGLRVTHLGAGGVGVVYAFDVPEMAGVRSGAMAVSGAGEVYLSDLTRPFVVRYSPFEGPTVVTEAASSVQARSAVLEGTIDPEGVASTYHFEYSTDLSFRSRTAEADAGSGDGAVTRSVAVSGLRPNTAYNFRIVGSNAVGSIVGATVQFSTLTAPPDVGPAFVSAIGPRSARLHGTVNPNTSVAAVNWYFEYGTTMAYGRTAGAADDNGLASCFPPNCGGDDVPVIASLSGLDPGTVYHFRVVAGPNPFGSPFDPVFGIDETFVTAPAAGGGATGVTTRRATLKGTINPHGVATSYHFNYGPTSSYGESTPEVPGGSGDSEKPVTQEVSGLSPDTTYHVQVVATSSDGVVRTGADGLFRTAPAPAAVVLGPTAVSTDAATLAGEVSTYGLTGSYHFDVWSLDSAYAVSTPKQPVSGSARVERVGAVVGGLPAGERFVVQLTADSNESVGVSDMLVFATAELPRVFPPPPPPEAVYGCGAPHLNAYDRRVEPGEVIVITGRDLGVGGSVMLGDHPLEPVGWSAGGFRVMVPEGAAGSLGLTVNCGRVSNTIAVAVFEEPENRFSVPSRRVAGSAATLRVRVPGPGKIETSGAHTQAALVPVKKAATATVKVKLTSAGRRALTRAKSRALRVRVRVRFTPAGGRAANKMVTVTFERSGGGR